jgi:hypothetical protein
VLVNIELLQRMNFQKEAAAFERLWRHLYGSARGSSIPVALLQSFPQAGSLVVDTICFQPYPQLGNKSLAQVVCFRPAHQTITHEAAQRLATGIDPGIIPARFLVGAARWAVERRLAAPEVVARNFYEALKQR